MIVKLKPDTKIDKYYHLTLDKEYVATVINRNTSIWFVTNIWYEIQCDDGMKREFSSNNFIPIDELRDKKLDDLGL